MATVSPSGAATFWSKVAVGQSNECWPWVGNKPLPNGYCQASVDGQPWGAHRFAFVSDGGVLLDGQQVDHLCHDPKTCEPPCMHRRCCNPAHLAAASPKTNNARSGSPSALNALVTRCPSAHPYDALNTYVDKYGRRSCITCAKARRVAWGVLNKDRLNAKRRERYAARR